LKEKHYKLIKNSWNSAYSNIKKELRSVNTIMNSKSSKDVSSALDTLSDISEIMDIFSDNYEDLNAEKYFRYTIGLSFSTLILAVVNSILVKSDKFLLMYF
jgi:hypothetical protein